MNLKIACLRLGGSLIPIVVCGEAVPALCPAGILPAAKNKGKMPSPHGDGFSPAKYILSLCDNDIVNFALYEESPGFAFLFSVSEQIDELPGL